MATVYERVKAVVVDKFGAEVEDIQEKTSFVEDLEADSLDLVELIMAFEDEFSDPKGSRLQIPDDEAANVKTVADVVSWLNAHGVEDQEEVQAAG